MCNYWGMLDTACSVIGVEMHRLLSHACSTNFSAVPHYKTHGVNLIGVAEF